MQSDSLEFSLLSIFSFLSFFSFFIIQKLSHKILKGLLFDNDFEKPPAFHKNDTPRSGGLACLISLFKYGKNDFVLGNIIGSNIANFTIFSIINLLFVIPLPSFAMSSLILILIAEIILFSFILIFSRRKSVPNYCGIFLLLLYIIFVFKV